MAHDHPIIDVDKHFTIDPTTRKVLPDKPDKANLVQFDHNSERLTFELPRYIDGHDMLTCNEVWVHFNNIEMTSKKTNPGVYQVTDLQISEEQEDILVCSWLVSQEATQLVGLLSFVVSFVCSPADGVVAYRWNSAPYTGISVLNGIFNSDIVLEEYADILVEWEERLRALEEDAGSIGAPGTATCAEVFNDYEFNEATGEYSHAEGRATAARGDCAHAEGYDTTALGGYSHAEGYLTSATGMSSHAEGEYTRATRKAQHVEGEFNVADDTESGGVTKRGKYIHIAGNGTSENDRSNAHTLDWNGIGWFAGGLKVGGTGQDDPEAKAVALVDDVADAVSEALADAKENGEFVVTQWYTSEGAPDFVANDGDYCVDTLNGVIYTNIGDNNWDVVISFSSSRIFVGEEVTMRDEYYISDIDGAKGGDYYINRVSGDMFYAEASSGKWEWSMSFKDIPYWYTGSGEPTESAKFGDFYLDLDSGELYQYTGDEFNVSWDRILNLKPKKGEDYWTTEDQDAIKDELKAYVDETMPQKGEDYFTAEDKAEIVQLVLEALPTWEGGSY